MDVRTDSQQRRSELAALGSRNRLLGLIGALGCIAVAACQPTALESLPDAPTTESPAAEFVLNPTRFADLPGWTGADFGSSLDAFRGSCEKITAAPPSQPLSKRAPYGGSVEDWLSACAAATSANSETAQVFFETSFTPHEIAPEADTSKLTGYFEPQLAARRTPEPGFEAAIPGPPEDLITIHLGDFDDALAPRRFWGQVSNGRFGLYPPRAEIVDDPAKALGFADPGDVFYLQIQGSGRIVFPDGEIFRAAFAAHNSRPFGSIARHLIKRGELSRGEAGMSGVKAWMREAGREAARDAMNINPRYVWFGAEPLTDPDRGPRGAQGVPLTPMASLAVDPRYHPYGAPMFIDTLAPRTPGDWKGAPFQALVVAQDTGGAITGMRRGDLFFGWGDEAGGLAASMNHELRMWVLLPNALAERIAAEAPVQPQ